MIEMRAEKLIATVNMEYNISENIFIPDRGEIKHVQEIFELQARRRTGRENVHEIAEVQQRMSNMNRSVRTIVEPQVNANGQRRSCRRRSVITHLE